MSKVRVAVSGGGIAGLCLAVALSKLDPTREYIQIDVYEASPMFSEVGAGLTLWGRVCEALDTLGLAQDCIDTSVIVASTSQRPSSSGFTLRDHRQPFTIYGKLPFRDAWSLHRKDLQDILLRYIPPGITHLSKRLLRYEYVSPLGPIVLYFSDNTTAECDVLIGADGIRSAVRAQMMREAAELARAKPELEDEMPYHRHVLPRYSGTIAYRALVNPMELASRNPNHPMLHGPQVYMGKSQHVVGYPISETVINIAINITPKGVPYSSSGSPLSPRSNALVDRSRTISRETFNHDVRPLFKDWIGQVDELLDAVDTSIEWPILDVEPLPFYCRERVALIGDAAHATVPYLGAGAAFAIEDAFILSRLLHRAAVILAASSMPRVRVLEHALRIFEEIRLPYGNKAVYNGRKALCDFQLCGPSGLNIEKSVSSIIETYEDTIRVVGGCGPNAECTKGMKLLDIRCCSLNGS